MTVRVERCKTCGAATGGYIDTDTHNTELTKGGLCDGCRAVDGIHAVRLHDDGDEVETWVTPCCGNDEVYYREEQSAYYRASLSSDDNDEVYVSVDINDGSADVDTTDDGIFCGACGDRIDPSDLPYVEYN